MLDNITSRLSFDGIGTSGYLKKAPSYIDNCYEAIHPTTKIPYLKGNLNNLSISISNTGLNISGSIPKYKNNNNFETLSMHEYKDIYTEISDLLHQPIYNSNVSKVEFGTSLEVVNSPKEYYPFLAYSNGYERNLMKGSLYFINTLRTLKFYNKRTELIKNGFVFPLELKNNNYLRYELKYDKNIANQFNKAKVQVHDLYNQELFNLLVQDWKAQFDKIIKHQTTTYEDMTSKTGQILLLEKYIHEKGMDETLQYIKTLKSKFSTEREYYRFRASIKEVNKTGVKSELMQELEDKINIMVDSLL
jgi:hypothetical protein